MNDLSNFPLKDYFELNTIYPVSKLFEVLLLILDGGMFYTYIVIVSLFDTIDNCYQVVLVR